MSGLEVSSEENLSDHPNITFNLALTHPDAVRLTKRFWCWKIEERNITDFLANFKQLMRVDTATDRVAGVADKFTSSIYRRE